MELFAQTKLIEDLKKQLKEANEALFTTLNELGVDTYHQDPVDGTVFKVVKPKGTYIEFKEIGYERTKKEGEERGTLSVKEATERGFKLPTTKKEKAA